MVVLTAMLYIFCCFIYWRTLRKRRIVNGKRENLNLHSWVELCMTCVPSYFHSYFPGKLYSFRHFLLPTTSRISDVSPKNFHVSHSRPRTRAAQERNICIMRNHTDDVCNLLRGFRFSFHAWPCFLSRRYNQLGKYLKIYANNPS